MDNIKLDALYKKYRMIVDIYEDDFLNKNVLTYEKMVNLLASCFWLLYDEAKSIDENVVKSSHKRRKEEMSIIAITNLMNDIYNVKNQLSCKKIKNVDIKKNEELIRKIYNNIWENMPGSSYLYDDNCYLVYSYVDNKKSRDMFMKFVDNGNSISSSERLHNILLLENEFILSDDGVVPRWFKAQDIDDMIERYIEDTTDAINMFEYLCKHEQELLLNPYVEDKNGFMKALIALCTTIEGEVTHIISCAKEREKEKYYKDDLHGCIMAAPVNEKGIEELKKYYNLEKENVISLHFSDEEYLILRKPNGLFDKFDSAFRILIGLEWQEKIDEKNIKKAIRILKDYKKNIDDEKESHLLIKIESLLERAKESKTFIEISVV